jgi:hypothetical protein
LGEIVGLLALLVAGLSLWDSHQERVRADRDRAAAVRQSAAAAIFLLRGEAEADGARLRLAPVRADQVIQSQLLVFPTSVRAGAIGTTGDARIEAAWIADGARRAARKAGDGAGGDLRLPVGIATSLLADGQVVSDQSIYWIGYRLKSRLLLPAKVELEGLSLARRSVGGDLRARLDAMQP